jgi:hypothetical protein
MLELSDFQVTELAAKASFYLAQNVQNSHRTLFKYCDEL